MRHKEQGLRRLRQNTLPVGSDPASFYGALPDFRCPACSKILFVHFGASLGHAICKSASSTQVLSRNLQFLVSVT
jgi:hypothetical protein